MDKLKALLKDKEKMRELISYLVFGVLTTVVSWGVYYVWRQAFGMTTYPTDSAAYTLIATSGQVVSFVLAVLFAFVTNKKYVFKSEKTAETGLWKEFALFVSARIMAWVLFDLALFNLLLLFTKNSIADADLWLKLLMNVLVVIFNYVASKWIIFKK